MTISKDTLNTTVNSSPQTPVELLREAVAILYHLQEEVGWGNDFELNSERAHGFSLILHHADHLTRKAVELMH